VLNEIEAETVLENCRSQKVRVTPARAGERPELSVALTAPRLRTLHRGSRFVLDRLSAFPSEDICTALKGGVKICQRQLVNEVLGLPVTECTLDSAYQGATPNQRALQGGLLVRI
jgi:hypothetical protein